MRNCIKHLFLFAAMMITSQCLKAANGDSGLVRMRDYIAQKIELQKKENEERVKKGLPKNYIVFADERELNEGTPPVNHVVTVKQMHTTDETIKGIWNFTTNNALKKLSEKLDSFSVRNGFDYYVVIAAIYNIDDDDETQKTDFSKLSWADIDGINDKGPVKLSQEYNEWQYYSTKAQTKFNKLAGMVNAKVKELAPNTLYHFIITTYFPLLPDNTESPDNTKLLGRVAHIQFIKNSDPSKNSFYNDEFTNYWQTHALNKTFKLWKTKEEWLLAASSNIQDFIADIRNFSQPDIMAINSPGDMQDYLTDFHNLEVLLKDISFVTRGHIIKVLSEGFLPNWRENTMLTVFKTTPRTQADSLETLLTENSYAILKVLNKNFDDAGVWGTGDNYTKFVEYLTNILNEGVSQAKLNEILAKRRIFNLSATASDNFLVNVFTNDLKKEYDKLIANGDSKAATLNRNFSRVGAKLDDPTSYWLTTYCDSWPYEYLFNVNKDEPQDGTYIANRANKITEINGKKVPDDSHTVTEALKPFDMILVIPQRDFEINGFQLTKGSMRLIPMYYYYWLKKKHDNQEWIDVGHTSLNVLLVASMVTGIGEIIESGNLAYGLVRGSLVLFDAKMLVNSLNKGDLDKELKKFLGSEAFAIFKFLEYCYITSIASQGASLLAVHAGSAISSAVTKLYTILKTSPEILSALKAHLPEMYSAFKTYFRDVLGKTLEAEAGISTLASKLTGSIKSTYDELIKAGLTTEEKAGSILMKNSEGETVAIIYNNKLTPTKWGWKRYYLDPEKIETPDGYIILKKGDDIKIDLGWGGRKKLSAQEANNYLRQGQGKDADGQPYWEETDIDEIILGENGQNDIIYIVENAKKNGVRQPNPGQYGSKDPITTIEELRQKLAVKEGWKATDDIPTLRKYRVIKPLKVRTGKIGPQTENGVSMAGGGHQYEIYDPLFDGKWSNYLELISETQLIGRLTGKLTGSIKQTFDNLITAGLKVEEKAESILMKNASGETVAIIHNNKLTPVKWSATYLAPKSSIQIKTSEGYIIIKDGDNISFDLGFKEGGGRKLMSDEVNNYLRQGQGKDLDGQPYWTETEADKVVDEQVLGYNNEEISFVENRLNKEKLQAPNPGQYASKDKITTVQELRYKLAVKEDWKKTVDDPTLRTYRVKKPLRVRSGKIGPQTEVNGVRYPGGGHQYEIIDFLGPNWQEYLELVSEVPLIK